MISNASPLILFASLNRLDLLKKVYGKVYISREVYEEVVVAGKNGNFPDSFIIESAVSKGAIEVIDLPRQNASQELRRTFPDLDAGETATIALAILKREKEVLIDGHAARQAAKLYGLLPRGAFRVLLEAYKMGLLHEQELSRLIREMTSSKFRLSPEVLLAFWDEFERLKKV